MQKEYSRMKKNIRFVSILLLAVVALFAVACSKDEASSSSSSTAASTGSAKSAAKTVVEVWTEDRHDLEYVEKKIAEYNANNTDNIEINLTVITENYGNMLALAVNGGTAPDVVGANSLDYNSFCASGMLMPLNSYIDNDPTYQEVNEPYDHLNEGLNAGGDNIYWVPSGMRSGVRVIYNKDLLEQCGYTSVPRDLASYIDMAADITRQGNGEFYGIGFTSSSPFERLLEMSAQCSGIYYYDYVNGRFDFSGYKPILELGRRFFTENIAYPDQQQVDNMRAMFTVGAFALWSNASQEAAVFTSQLPVEDFEWTTAEVPTLTGEVEGALQITVSKGYGIVSTSTKKDAAWKVISYFQSEDFLKGYLESGYCLPITEYMDQRIDKSKIGKLADFSLVSYEAVYPQPPAINLTGDDYRTVLWNAVMGYVSIDDAIADLNKRYNDALERDVKNGSIKRLVIKDYDPLHPDKGTAEYLTT